MFKLPTKLDTPKHTPTSLWTHSKMPSLISNGTEIGIKDWGTMKPWQSPPPPLSHWSLLPTQTILSSLSTSGFPKTLKPHQTCNPSHPLWQTNARSRIHDALLVFTETLSQVWGTVAQLREERTPSPSMCAHASTASPSQQTINACRTFYWKNHFRWI